MANGFHMGWLNCRIPPIDQRQPVDSRYIRVSITDAQATPILNGVSVHKTPASIEETDGYPLGLTYHSDRTADRANGQWNEEEKAFEAPLCGPRKKELP